MPHFFIRSKDVKDNKISIYEDYNHIAKSLRARVGEKILLIDENQIQYETVIDEITSKSVVVNVVKSYKSNRNLGFKLYLAQSPLCSSAQNFVIEKAAELGAAGVYPVLTDNCTLKKSAAKSKTKKWRRIMYEASKQCERSVVPEVFDVCKLEDLPNCGKVIAFCERKASLTLHGFLSENPVKPKESVLVIIGPEGGFSDREFKYFEDKGIPAVTLGNLILKAETAVIAALGNIIYEFNK
ncbi:MAG: 16S rRNA (uracil(1498)-N(3))-methyltransferase [Heliobacteriaceae bacterium]|jgi:16S rRNA (uracil1498-N3)-methyltransferase|nr:16S rRNA (uracil(1498)-N(3))-methyltransferase [Heliobacteriaceae bacterium]